jgi:CRP-like cAMP-binding protein
MPRGKDTKLDQLARVRLFSSCNKKELTLIGRESEEVQVPAGRVLCEEGKPGFEFYLLLDGQAAVRRSGRKVATLGPGGHFGELALLTRLPRNATVEAATDCHLLVLGQREFSGLLDTIPGLAHKMLTYVGQRLYEADTKSVHH